VIGDDSIVASAGAQGNFELNAMRPIIINNVLHSARILGDACEKLRRFSVEDTELDRLLVSPGGIGRTDRAWKVPARRHRAGRRGRHRGHHNCGCNRHGGAEPAAAWEQPIVRVVDTAIGIAVALAASWLATNTFPLDRARSYARAQGG
jgi:hypothetical protein